MPTTMEKAMQVAGIPMKSQSERLWLWVKDHPNQTARQISLACHIETSKGSTLISQMFQRGMLERQEGRITGPKGPRVTWFYSTPSRMAVYEYGPKIVQAKTKKGVPPCTITKLEPEVLQPVPPTGGDLDDDVWVMQTIEALPLLRGQMLYLKLKEIFHP